MLQVESTGLDDYVVKLKELQEAKHARQEALDRASKTVFKALLGMPEQARPSILQPERQNTLRGMLSSQRSSSNRFSETEEGAETTALTAGMEGSIRARLKGEVPRMTKAEEERRERQERRSQGRLQKAEVIRCVAPVKCICMSKWAYQNLLSFDRLLSEASSDQVPEALMREPAIQALLNKVNYTKACMRTFDNLNPYLRPCLAKKRSSHASEKVRGYTSPRVCGVWGVRSHSPTSRSS